MRAHSIADWPRVQKITFAVLAALVILRCVLFTVVIPRPEMVNYYGDSLQYREFGEALYDGTAFQWTAENPLDIKRTIGYPLMLAGVAKIFGTNPLNLVAVQLFLSGLVGLLIYLYLMRKTRSGIAAVTAILYLCDPLTLAFSLQMMTENPFTFLVVIAFIFLLLWRRRNQLRYLLLAGLLLGIACLIRPIGQVLIVFWGLVVVLLQPEVQDRSFRSSVVKRTRNVLLFLLPITLMLVPWIIRNSIVWDCPTISYISRHNLRDYIAAGVLADVQGVPIEESKAQLVAIDPGYCPKNSMLYYRILWEHPVAYLKLAGIGTLNTIGFSGDMVRLWLTTIGIHYVPVDLWQPYLSGGLAEVFRVLSVEMSNSRELALGVASLVVYQLLLYGLALAGLLAWRSRSKETNLEVLISLGTVLVLMLTPMVLGDARFRVPAQPFLLTFAGFGIAWILRRLKNSKGGVTSNLVDE